MRTPNPIAAQADFGQSECAVAHDREELAMQANVGEQKRLQSFVDDGTSETQAGEVAAGHVRSTQHSAETVSERSRCDQLDNSAPGAGLDLQRGTSKIRTEHRDRVAIVYIRQSSPQQVLNNRESRERQYALVERAIAFGWPRERVRIIDEDQGTSAKINSGRSGFEELLVEVSLDHVGMILGLEMSRMSRCCRDWYQLMEVCAVFGTVLADLDGIYDPTDVNDRLVLGLKATISEMELHTMRNRLYMAKLNKAKRGELFSHLPRGYVMESGRVVLDPDEQVQTTIRLVLTKFAELKNAHAVLRYLVRAGICLPVRPHAGPNRGILQWRRPHYSTVRDMLAHPIYGGAYTHGRRKAHVSRKGSEQGRRAGVRYRAAEECDVLLLDRLPAYISWEQYQKNQRQLQGNCTRMGKPAVPRKGKALLVGVLVCGRCGWRLRAMYHRGAGAARYSCSGRTSLHCEPECQALCSRELDELVTHQVLRALEPASLELNVQAREQLELERARQSQQWRQRLERASYESDRASRQYQAVEPENRLVARELERRWEQALADQRQLEEEHARWKHESRDSLSVEEREVIQSLAGDIVSLWNAPSTSMEDRKTIVRHLVERIVVNVEGRSEWVQATIHWAGGFQSVHQFRRSVASYEQLEDYSRLMSRLSELRAQGATRSEIAEQLNQEGFHPPKAGQKLTAGMVATLLRSLRSCAAVGNMNHGPLGSPRIDSRAPVTASQTSSSDATRSQPETLDIPSRADHEWPGPALTQELKISAATLTHWRQLGWIVARHHFNGPTRWIYLADEEELARLRRLVSYPKPSGGQRYPVELTTPKKIASTA